MLDLSASNTARLTGISLRSINGIYIKLRLARMKGIQPHMFYLHLKETEFRFNHHRDSVYQRLLKFLRELPI